MSISKNSICNLALSRLGNKSSIEDIDSPKKPAEFVFAKWWDASRRLALKELMPSFAKTRRKIAKDAETPEFGYSARFAYPSDCIRVLGFGEIKYKQNTYSIEGGWILTDDYSTDDDDNIYLPLRFVKDITDTTKYTPEFVEGLSWYLAYVANMEITQDLQKQTLIEKVINSKKAQSAGIDSQESMPIRINQSKFKLARYSTDPTITEKL